MNTAISLWINYINIITKMIIIHKKITLTYFPACSCLFVSRPIFCKCSTASPDRWATLFSNNPNLCITYQT